MCCVVKECERVEFLCVMVRVMWVWEGGCEVFDGFCEYIGLKGIDGVLSLFRLKVCVK